MMENSRKKTLLLAIGNAARGDDGLGWAFAESLEQKGSFPGDIVMRYQLQVEDAELCTHYERVFFVDAWNTEAAIPFQLEPCLPVQDFSFTTHAVSPQGVLHLCQDLYGKQPECWLLLLKGISWELGEPLSREGEQSLKQGLAFFEERLFREVPI